MPLMPPTRRVATLFAALLMVMAMPRLALAAAIPWEGVEITSETFTAKDGVPRSVTYLRPPNAGPNTPAVFLLHYNQAGGQAMANLTDAGELARDYGVWVVLPIIPAAEDRKWAISPAVRNQPDHVAFLDEMIDYSVAKYAIDPKRIYMMGYSQGGNMTVRFACERPGKIAAGATVAAIMLRSLRDACDTPVGTPMLFMEGTDDQQVNYNGTLLGLCTLNATCTISAKSASEFWAGKNACSTTPVRSDLPNSVDDGTNVTVDRYGSCSGSSLSKVALYTIVNGGHVWPGAIDFTPRLGLTTQDIKAGPTILNQFFLQFRLP